MHDIQKKCLGLYYEAEADALLAMIDGNDLLSENADYFIWRGAAYVLINDIDAAKEQLKAGMDLLNRLGQAGYENLSLLALLLGDFSLAKLVVESGIREFPKSCWLHARSAYLNYQYGMNEEAYTEFQTALEMDNEIPIALQFLDFYRWKDDPKHIDFCLKLIREALKSISQEKIWAPNSLCEKWRSRLVGYSWFFILRTGDLAGADAAFQNEKEWVSDTDNAAASYASTLFSTGYFEEANKVLHQQLEVNPKSLQAMGLLAQFANRLGRKQVAHKWGLRLHREMPDDLEPLFLLADGAANSSLKLVDIWLKKIDFLASQKSFTALELESVQIRCDLLRARAFFEAQDYKTSEVLLRNLLKTSPDLAPAQMLLGQLYVQIGRIEGAVALFDSVKSINPVGGHLALMNARVFPEDPLTSQRLESVANSMGYESTTRDAILFQLAAAHEHSKDFDKAFALAVQANDFSKALLPYDPVAHRSRCQRIMARFSTTFKQTRAAYGHASSTPVFVLGMPRSGTTLVEQLLSGHSRIHGAGELGQIPQVIAGLDAWERKLGSGRTYPDCVDDLSTNEVAKIAANLLDKLREFAPDADFIIDKLPHNFENIGIIKLLFPNAKIISVRRDYRDIALSNYFTDYQAKHGGMGFAYDLQWIRDQLADHMLLMHHWSRVFPGEILEVRYEDLVEDTEVITRKMLAYIGVDWEPQVLNSHELDRPVKTASVWQVRQPIYKSSKAKWMHYEKYLSPLIQEGTTEIKLYPMRDWVTLPEPGLFVEGIRLIKEGELDKAEYAFKKLLHHLPAHASANYMVGSIYVRKGHINEGLDLMEKALSKQPHNKFWARGIHDACMATGESEKRMRAQALADLYKFIDPNPEVALVAVESELDSLELFWPVGEL